jgi:LacI family transcriptional regulator
LQKRSGTGKHHITVTPKPVSIKDVALKCGCSIATISLVLNGRGKISDATKKRVTKVVASMGYVPNLAGRNLRSNRTNTIGLFFYPSCAQLFRNVFYAEIMESLESHLGAAGYNLLLAGGDFSGQQTRSLALISQRRIDAAIMLGAFPVKQIEALGSSGVPLLLLDSDLDKLPVDSITTDGYNAGRLIVDHLCAKGHRRIIMLAYDLDDYNIDMRTDGFLAGLKHYKLPVAGSLIRNFVQNDQGIVTLLRRLKGPQAPTAVVCVNDTMASFMMNRVREAGFSIPDQVSFVGYDDDIYAREALPKLTTIAVDKAAIGQAGAECILRRMKTPSTPVAKSRLPVKLVERDSVAKLKA